MMTLCAPDSERAHGADGSGAPLNGHRSDRLTDGRASGRAHGRAAGSASHETSEAWVGRPAPVGAFTPFALQHAPAFSSRTAVPSSPALSFDFPFAIASPLRLCSSLAFPNTSPCTLLTSPDTSTSHPHRAALDAAIASAGLGSLCCLPTDSLVYSGRQK